MIRKLSFALLIAGTTTTYAFFADAQGAAYWGPHGAAIVHSGPPGGRFYGGGSCCYRHHGAAAAAIAGLAVGTAVGIASRPVYRAPQVVGYAAPPVIYASPPVVYAAPVNPYYYAH